MQENPRLYKGLVCKQSLERRKSDREVTSESPQSASVWDAQGVWWPSCAVGWWLQLAGTRMTVLNPKDIVSSDPQRRES